MVTGQTYKLDQLVTNVEASRSSIDVITPKDFKYDTTKIT